MLLACFVAAGAAARQQELDALRARIGALTKELERSEESRKEARDALRDSELAISQANRALARLDAEARQARAEAAAIAGRQRALERELAERQAAIARLLRARAAAGTPDALRVTLSGGDPGEVSRRLHYAGYVSRATVAMLEDYRARITEAEQLARDAQARRERLRSLEAAIVKDRETLLAQQQERQRVLQRLSAEIRGSRREIKVLRADEARLARLVEKLSRLMAERVERLPQPQARKAPFSRLRGELSLPVRGELTNRFGAPRGSAGTEAKGVFIRAPEGQPVRAVAHGAVVYADWMRGFGNLLIVDHGEAYLTIYANAESLLKQVGDVVSMGEAIATTGASGGNEETGLYFEMRHLGRAFDPLRWVKLK